MLLRDVDSSMGILLLLLCDEFTSTTLTTCPRHAISLSTSLCFGLSFSADFERENARNVPLGNLQAVNFNLVFSGSLWLCHTFCLLTAGKVNICQTTHVPGDSIDTSSGFGPQRETKTEGKTYCEINKWAEMEGEERDPFVLLPPLLPLFGGEPILSKPWKCCFDVWSKPFEI